MRKKVSCCTTQRSLLCKIYEDNILGKLSDSRYATLDAQYEKEQTELTAEISVLELSLIHILSLKPR